MAVWRSVPDVAPALERREQHEQLAVPCARTRNRYGRPSRLIGMGTASRDIWSLIEAPQHPSGSSAACRPRARPPSGYEAL